MPDVAGVLAEHPYTYPDSFCGCGEYVGESPWRDHPAHVAAMLEPVIAAAKAEALREAADECDEIERIGQTPYCDLSEAEVDAFYLHPLSIDDLHNRPRPGISTWLRGIADQIAKP